MILGLDGYLILTIRKRIECDFYDTILISGATKFTFWMSHYIKDLLMYSFFGIIFYIIMRVFSIVPEGMVELYFMFIIIQPIYLYAVTHFFSAVLNKKGFLLQILSVALVISANMTSSSVSGMRKANTPSL